MPRESEYQQSLRLKIRMKFPNCVVLKNDPSIVQGFPDLLVLNGNRWAALEIKKSRTSILQPNQAYWVDWADEMSFGRIIYPENEREVLRELQRSFFS